MGKTSNLAQLHGYYLGKFPSSFGQNSDAKFMYAGALLYLVMLRLSLIGIGAGIFVAAAGRVENNKLLGSVIIGAECYTWIESWLFWVGYLKLAGPLKDVTAYSHEGFSQIQYS